MIVRQDVAHECKSAEDLVDIPNHCGLIPAFSWTLVRSQFVRRFFLIKYSGFEALKHSDPHAFEISIRFEGF